MFLLMLISVASASAEGTLYSGVPSDQNDRSVAAFSDLGAWFGFALPTDDRPDLAGAFVGPLLFDEGIWASEALLRPVVTIDGKKIDLAAAKTSYDSPPGRLLQRFNVEGMRLAFSLHYEYEKRAVIHVQAYSSYTTPRDLHIAWVVGASPPTPEGSDGPDTSLLLLPVIARTIPGRCLPGKGS